MEKLEGPKACQEREFGPTLDLLNLVFRTSRGQPPDIGQNFPHMYQESNRHNLHIIKVGGKVASHVGIFPAQVAIREVSLKVAGIGGVATHPDYRKRGYAYLLLQDCLRKMERENFDLSILWTGIPDFYRPLGWENAGHENAYFLDKGNISLLPLLNNAELQEGYEDHLDQIHQLHSKEALRVIRSKKSMATLLGRPGLETFLALRNQVPTAYIVVGEDGVRDYAGQPEAIAGLLREVFQEREMRHLTVFTPHLGGGLPKTLEDLGIPKQQGYAGMLRVINLESLLKKLKLADIDFQQKEDKFVLRRGGNVVEVNLRMLPKLIFGPERVSDFGEGLFPIAFYWGHLDHV